MTVYFIQAGENGPVKIGTSEMPHNQLYILQSGHYEPLSIIREVDGGRIVEKQIHDSFDALRIRGEWFRFDERMMSFQPKATDYDSWIGDQRISGQEFKRLRKLLGLSQPTLGEAMGRCRRQIIRYEKPGELVDITATLAMECLVRRQEEAA